MGKVLHKVFRNVVKQISQDLLLGEFVSEVAHFISEPRNFAEFTKLVKASQKKIKKLINNQTFLVEDPKKGEPVTPCMDVYKAKIHSDGSLDKLKFRTVVRGDL